MIWTDSEPEAVTWKPGEKECNGWGRREAVYLKKKHAKLFFIDNFHHTPKCITEEGKALSPTCKLCSFGEMVAWLYACRFRIEGNV